jgi:hypothetical protein
MKTVYTLSFALKYFFLQLLQKIDIHAQLCMHEVGHFLTYIFFTVVRLKLLKPYITVCEMRFHTHIICFKIKNPPALHSTSKLQPTTSPSFVFSAFASVRKKWGYEKKLLTVI